MSYIEPARATPRRIPGFRVAGLLVVSAAIAAALGYPVLSSSSSTAAPPIDVFRTERRGAALATGPDSPHAGGLRDRGPAPTRGPDPVREPAGDRPGSAPGPPGAAAPVWPGGAARAGADPRARPQRGALGEADGAVPYGTTVFDDQIPGVAKLAPALLGALRQAATDAADHGVEFYVSSGWRSPEYAKQLFHEAVSKYGSEEEAARWVATPNTSAHVSGDAVDLAPVDATAWLSRHGARYGLCQIYRNEPWHYELRPQANDHGCPLMYADPTHDPRMQH